MGKLVLVAAAMVMGMLGACGAEVRQQQTPEEVHARWVVAVRANDRVAALDLAAATGQEALFVDHALGRMQQILAEQSNGNVHTGTLQGVDVLPLRDAGQGKVGISVWRFDEQTWCWQTELTPSPTAGWQVVGWSQRLDCPPTQ